MTAQGLSNQSLAPNPHHHRRRTWLKFAIAGTVLVIALTLCVYATLTLVRSSTPRSHRIQITTDVSRRNVLLVEQLRAEAARRSLDIVPTAKEYGTLAALAEVDSPSEIKLGLIIGGVTKGNYPNVRTVTTLSKEHLHLVVKAELADKGIAGLRGKRIFLGPPTTASHHVARDVLDFVGLRPTVDGTDGGYFIDTTSREQALREMERIKTLGEPERAEAIARLPDAALVLAPLPSPYVKPLVTDFGYRLVPLPFAEAYRLDPLNPTTASGVRIERSMLNAAVIPAYTYASNPAEPAKDCPTICAPLVLVAQDDVAPEAISLLLTTIYDTPLNSLLHPPALNEQVNTFPRHPGTERYLRRNDPLLTHEVAARLGTVVGGIGAFLSGVIAFYSFLRLRNLNRFESYYHEIAEIEMVACGLQEDPAAPTDLESLRANLEGKLASLKCRVLEEFADGGLRGEALMAGIIALINDTRESLAGMVTVRNRTRQGLLPDKREHVAP